MQHARKQHTMQHTCSIHATHMQHARQHTRNTHATHTQSTRACASTHRRTRAHAALATHQPRRAHTHTSHDAHTAYTIQHTTLCTRRTRRNRYAPHNTHITHEGKRAHYKASRIWQYVWPNPRITDMERATRIARPEIMVRTQSKVLLGEFRIPKNRTFM